MAEAELFVRGLIIGLEIAVFIGLLIITFYRSKEEKSSDVSRKTIISLIGDILQMEEGNLKAMDALSDRISSLETALYDEETEEEEAEENE